MLLILDVDGVLTDGKKHYDNSGKCIAKTFCDRDFTVIKQFKAAGWKVVFLSGDRTINEAIAVNRNIPFYCNRNSHGMIDKADFVVNFEKEYGIPRTEMYYVGDDIFDIGIMKVLGKTHSFCPVDSPKSVHENATVLLVYSGDNLLTEVYDYCIDNKLIQAPSIEKVIEIDKYEQF